MQPQQINLENEKMKEPKPDDIHEEAMKQPEESKSDSFKPMDDIPLEDSNRKLDGDDESSVETEEEISHLHDSEEFEGFDKEMKKETGKPDLKIAKVPHHLTTSWENYYLELLMVAGLIVYMANFFKGKAKNSRLANAWFDSHKELLEANFSLVGEHL